MEKVQPPPRESLSGGGLPVNVGFSRANSPSEIAWDMGQSDS